MKYRGIINFDLTNTKGFTSKQKNARTELSLALVESGWLHVETSAYTRDTDDVSELWDGAFLVAKQTHAHKLPMSAFTFHIQSSADFTSSISSTSTLSPTNALATIRALPFP